METGHGDRFPRRQGGPRRRSTPGPNPSRGLFSPLATDASDTHVGAVLQQQVGKHWQPLGFFSKKLSKPRYTTPLLTENCSPPCQVSNISVHSWKAALFSCGWITHP
jgi:hypothetical protein